MVTQGIELVDPTLLRAPHPVPQVRHRGGPQRVDTNPRVVVVRTLLDDQATTEHTQVLAHRGGAHTELAGELARAPRSGREQLDSSPSEWIGERVEGEVDWIGRRRHFHVEDRIGDPIAASASARDTSRTWVEKVHEWPSGSRAR